LSEVFVSYNITNAELILLINKFIVVKNDIKILKSS
jgi:hypothetical protein